MNPSQENPVPDRDGERYRLVFEAATDGIVLLDLDTGAVVEANPAACAMHGHTREAFIGLLPPGFIHPDSQRAFMDLTREVRSGMEPETQVQHICQNGSTFHAEWRATAITLQGRSYLLGAVRNVSNRHEAEHRLQQRVAARTREQAALLEISHALASTLQLQPDLILEQLLGIIEYTYAGLFRLTDSTLVALAVRGPQLGTPLAGFEVRLESPETLAALFNGHRPIRIADVRANDPAAEFLRSLLMGEAAALLESARAWMWVPLAVKGRIIGGLGVAHTQPDFFTAHHAALVLSMADQVAMTMVNAELYEQARALAALQERQRLARNLHDAVNQSLFSAGLIAEVLPRLWELDPAEARESLEDLRRLTRGALAEMRELLAELRPSVLTESSLGDLLRQLANAFAGRTNIPASVTIDGNHVLPAGIQVALYRICQEALSNIGKHAGARSVRIDLHFATEESPRSSSLALTAAPGRIVVRAVELRIHDDGVGFDPAQPAPSGHYGLDMMRERAEAVGAHLTLTSQPGRGTEILVRWQQPPELEAR
jgi:PAS domain S-box-containing protein